MAAVAQQRTSVGIAPACTALSIPRATFYRWQKPKEVVSATPRPVARALPPEERRRALSLLNDERFADLPPAQVYATLLDEGKYLLFDPHPVSGAPGERTGPRATPSASPSPLSGAGTVGHPPRSKVRPNGPTSPST